MSAISFCCSLGQVALGIEEPLRAPLPPEIPWHGASESLIVSAHHPWVTPTEKSGLVATPRYRETLAWLRRLESASPWVRLVSLGRSLEGREIWMVVVSRDKDFTPEKMRAIGKPLLFVQAGIHAGEIDGKDAGLMFLRDLTVRGTKSKLLDQANLLFVPILNVDGHERFSAFNRINQRGPAQMGWRTNANNLNLNRDFAKLDTPEMQSLVRALDLWAPDLYLDIHVTDGVDYQYDITFGHNDEKGYSPAISKWLAESLTPVLQADLKQMGHIPGPLIFAVDDLDISKGIWTGNAGPRFSNDYGDARHLPTLLVENHSLKPYRQRVLGTYVLIESAMRVLGQQKNKRREVIAIDQQSRPKTLPLSWKVSSSAASKIRFLGVSSRLWPSEISGKQWIEWSGRPIELEIPYLISNEPDLMVRRPLPYWMPPGWQEIVKRLELHGIKTELLKTERRVKVTEFQALRTELAARPFEGHVGVKADLVPKVVERTYFPGSVRISTDQPLGDLAILLLEPGSSESFFKWGFFLSALQESEYVEAYVMEPLARQMLGDDPLLKKEFEKKLQEDPQFAQNPRERLQWLFRRTPYYGDLTMRYPVGLETGN